MRWENEAQPALISEIFLGSASAWLVFPIGRLIGDGAQGRTKLEAPLRQARQGSSLCWEGWGPGEQGFCVFVGTGMGTTGSHWLQPGAGCHQKCTRLDKYWVRRHWCWAIETAVSRALSSELHLR